MVSRWGADGVHVEPGWRSADLHQRCGRKPSAQDDILGGCEYFTGMESEDGQANHICERPRRRAGAVPGELGRFKRGEAGYARHGIRRRSGMVTEWTIARI